MELNMDAAGSQKKENFSVIRGGQRYTARPARIFTAAELRLDSEMAEVVGSIRGANGKAPSRGFERVTYGEAFPWRVLARWFVAARKADAPKAQLIAVVDRLRVFIDKLYADQAGRAA